MLEAVRLVGTQPLFCCPSMSLNDGKTKAVNA